MRRKNKVKPIFIMAMLLTAQILAQQSAPTKTTTRSIEGTPLSEIKSLDGKEYRNPELRRLYISTFTTKRGWFKITLECYTIDAYLGRSCSTTLMQEDGKKVEFDPTRVADRIMHSELLPIIEEFTGKATALDNAYIRSSPDHFVSEDGTVWVRRAKR